MAMTTRTVFNIQEPKQMNFQEPPATVTTNAAETKTPTPVFSQNSSDQTGYLNRIAFYQGAVDLFLKGELTKDELRKIHETFTL
jgi:hypothetical protein